MPPFIQKALTVVQVDQIDYDNEGNLLQYAVKMNHTGYLQILIDYGWAFFQINICFFHFHPAHFFLSLDPMTPLAFRSPLMSPLEEAIERGHMEVWNILKDHIEKLYLYLYLYNAYFT